MSKIYTASSRTLSPVPRSKRLRELGGTVVVESSASQVAVNDRIWLVQPDGSVKLNPAYTCAWTDGFMSSGGLSDTEPAGGANLATVWDSLQNAISDHTYDGRKIATAHLPTLGSGLAYSSSGSGSSLATTLSIASGYKLPTTTEWGNKADASALAGYVPISTPVTVSAAHTFSGGIILQSGTSWASTDRAIPFSMSGKPANIRYYSDDADKGLTFNPYSGALKAASFVKRGGTSSQFLKADGSVDRSAYITGITSSMVTAALGYTPANTSALANYVPIATATEITAKHTFASGFVLANGQSISAKDSTETARSLMYLGSTNILQIGYYVATAGYDTKLSGNNIYLRYGSSATEGLKLDSNGVLSLYGSTAREFRILNTGTNVSAGSIFFGANSGERNGFKIASEFVTSSSSRQDLIFYCSNNTTSPYTFTPVELLRLRYNGRVGIKTSAPSYELDVTGDTRTSGKLYIGTSGAYLTIVDGNVYLGGLASGKGFWTDGFMSSGGLSDTEPAGGIDALAMWKLLTNNSALSAYDSNTKIASAHIPIATASAVGGIKVGSNLSISNGVLSATDTTYSAGTGLTLSGSIFSLDVSSAKTALGLGSNAYTSTAYLPLAGGTMTSTAFISWGENFKTDWNASFNKGLQIFSSQVSGSNAPTQYATALSVIGQYGFQLALKGGNFSNFYIRSIASNQRTWYELLHTGNYNSFVPTLTGTGASGTWGISVTGSAASLSSGITLWGKSGINAGTSYGGDLTIKNAAYLNFKDAAGTGNAGRIYATSSDYFRIECANGISLRTGSTIATKMYISSSGNVGIGNTSPAYALDVTGSGYFSSGVRVANGTGLYAKNSAGTDVVSLVYLTSNDNLNVGYDVAVAGKATYINGNPIVFRYYSSGLKELARMTTDGYFGIGTTTPAYTLDVAGKMYASQGVVLANGYAYRSLDSNGTERALLYLSASNALSLGNYVAQAGNDTYLSGNNLYLRYGTGNTVGATLTSTGDFQVANTLTITNTSAAAHIGFSRTGLNYITAPATGSINFVLGTTLSSSASVLRLLDGSAILNGTLSASDAITLSGTTAATRRIYFGDSSKYLELNSNGFHFVGAGVYSDSFMSSGGLSDSGSYLGSVAEDIVPDATRTRNLGSVHRHAVELCAQNLHGGNGAHPHRVQPAVCIHRRYRDGDGLLACLRGEDKVYDAGADIGCPAEGRPRPGGSLGQRHRQCPCGVLPLEAGRDARRGFHRPVLEGASALVRLRFRQGALDGLRADRPAFGHQSGEGRGNAGRENHAPGKDRKSPTKRN